MAMLAGASGAAEEPGNFDAHYQSTYVWQTKRPFQAAYSGPNSLSPVHEKSYSFTATAALGFRPWRDGEIYFNPELSQGVPLSGLTGLGGFSNGEIARTAGPTPKLYRARLFMRQTWGYGGGNDLVESDFNQLAGAADRRRLVLTAGNLSVLDIFDGNQYSHDPRTQFMNWSLMTHGAYDYAADSRGYSWGLALEYFHDDWAVRAGRFIQPREPNQQKLDPAISRHYGDQLELERAYSIGGRVGTVRLLAFRNRANMAEYRDALNLAAQVGGVPALSGVRGDKVKRGLGLSVEQGVTENIGMFGRVSRSDGRTETYAFTELDNSASAGAVIKGASWGRAEDTFGIAVARNGLSREHRDYLAAGGIAFFLGDGNLNYAMEAVVEAFYSLKVVKGGWISFDLQRIRNPGYNADRGPAKLGAIRLHWEF